MHAFVLRQSRPRNLLLAALSCGLASCDANTAPDGDHPQQDNTATGSTTDPTSMLPDCTTPTDLASAMADLNNARPCWPWLDEQAAQLPRKALPPFGARSTLTLRVSLAIYLPTTRRERKPSTTICWLPIRGSIFPRSPRPRHLGRPRQAKFDGPMRQSLSTIKCGESQRPCSTPARSGS